MVKNETIPKTIFVSSSVYFRFRNMDGSKLIFGVGTELEEFVKIQ